MALGAKANHLRQIPGLRESRKMVVAEDYHLKAKKDVVEELRSLTPQFASIGNCVKPNTITYAVYQGYHAALDIH